MRVLVVDDAAVSRAAFALVAVGAGHIVVAEAAEAGPVPALLDTHEPDALVIDGRLEGVLMPELIARVRAAHPALRIVVVAALDESALVRAALDAGASCALLRPFLPSHVAAALATPNNPALRQAQGDDE
jgi:DNA-binding NarL/FixJ family response regulator